MGATAATKVLGRVAASQARKVRDRLVCLAEAAGQQGIGLLLETGQARPAPYLARAKWVAFDRLADLEADEVRGWLAAAHALVAARLTRKARAELGLAV